MNLKGWLSVLENRFNDESKIVTKSVKMNKIGVTEILW